VTSKNSPPNDQVAKTVEAATRARGGRKPKGLVPTRTGQKSKYDWEQARIIYIEGIAEKDDKKKKMGLERSYPTLAEVGELLGIPAVQVRQRASKERWTDLRNQAQIQATMKRQAERSKALAGEVVDFDERALGVAKVGIGLITSRLAEIAKEVGPAQERRKAALELKAQGIKVEREDLYSAVNYRELDGLARAAQTFQDIGRKALGTDIERHEITGADGGPIEQIVSVSDELLRDDAERLTAFLSAASRAGLLAAEDEEGDVVEAEIVDEDYEDEEGE
jgi:hypothetical protein